MIAVFLFMVGLAGWLLGGLVLYVAETRTHSAVHEIEALLLFILGAIGLGFAGVLRAFDDRRAEGRQR